MWSKVGIGGEHHRYYKHTKFRQNLRGDPKFLADLTRSDPKTIEDAVLLRLLRSLYLIINSQFVLPDYLASTVSPHIELLQNFILVYACMYVAFIFVKILQTAIMLGLILFLFWMVLEVSILVNISY